MAKYIIDVPDNTQWIQWMNVSEKDGSACFDYKAPKDLTPYVRSESYIDGLKKGQNEVWEFTGKIQKMTCEQMHEVLGITAPNYDYFCNEISYQEAKSKYEAWKAEKDEIHVGDELKQITVSGSLTGEKCIVVKIDGDKMNGIKKDGSFVLCSSQVKRWWAKTGRSFPEVKELLKKMKKESYK